MADVHPPTNATTTAAAAVDHNGADDGGASSSVPRTNAGTSTVGTAAAAALALLLREDPLLIEKGLAFPPQVTDSSVGGDRSGGGGGGAVSDDANEEAAFSYAASLLVDSRSADESGWTSSSGEYRQRAAEALAEVDRKLALVEGLAQRVSRDAPQEVAGPLLRLHGFELRSSSTTSSSAQDGTEEEGGEPYGTAATGAAATTTTTTTLASTRDRADRLRRQTEVLDGVARRVESTLQRGLTRMESATGRLERVLRLSSTLKMVLRLQFEARKVRGSGLDLDALSSGSSSASLRVDLRDLTRAAAGVAAMEELLSSNELTPPPGSNEPRIDAVEKMRPDAELISAAVRQAAAGLLSEQQRSSGAGGGGASRLGATLQVYYHLGELQNAAWGAASDGLASAEKASSQFFNPAAVQRLMESAKAEAKALVESGGGGTEDGAGGSGSGSAAADDTSASNAATVDRRQRKKQTEAAYERTLKKKLREKRAAAASKWATHLADAALQVWNLHRVLARRSDPVTRRNFLEVVKESDVPDAFRAAEARLFGGSSSDGGSSNKTAAAKHKHGFSVFALFWAQACVGLGARIQRLLRYDSGSLAADVAALYPAVRSAALDVVADLIDTMQAGTLSSSSTSSAAAAEDVGTSGVSGGQAPGIMGGSAALDDAVFLGWAAASGGGGVDPTDDNDADAAAGFGAPGADAWTRVTSAGDEAGSAGGGGGGRMGRQAGASCATSSSLSSVFSSAEWVALQGDGGGGGGGSRGGGETPSGLNPLQRAFLDASSERLCAPLKFMFPEAVSVDENGVAVSVLPALPSRYDLRKLDANVREELSLADPREGGGELSMTTMISENVVDMVERFCGAARGATSEAGEGGILRDDGTATEALAHDVKVAGVMNTLATALRNAPENTFIAPYRPAQSPQHEEASHMCQISLLPALHEIDSLVRTLILNPLCRALNGRVSTAIAKMHQGTYLEDSGGVGGAAGSFVQMNLTSLYEQIAEDHLSKLPSDYASIVASIVATYSIYAFVSNASLVRPLGEMGRLRITQDLADFELALEQLVFKGGTSTSLSQMDGGKPYAELRAVRQMLFWTGLEDKSASPAEIAKGMLREEWVKDVRPSTAFHFLFSFGPNLLSSPHHSKRMSPEEYVSTLVKFDGSIDDGEASAWMTTMACCDAYQQRESVDGRTSEGDRRVAAILMMLGPELLRRRRQ